MAWVIPVPETFSASATTPCSLMTSKLPLNIQAHGQPPHNRLSLDKVSARRPVQGPFHRLTVRKVPCHVNPVLALQQTGSREEGWRGERMSSGCREVTTTCSGAHADQQQVIRRHSPPWRPPRFYYIFLWLLLLRRRLHFNVTLNIIIYLCLLLMFSMYMFSI